MFGGKKDNQFAKGGHTLFDHALEIDGNVRFSGVLDIEGTVNGNIESVDGLDALIRVREKGRVNGDIKSPKVIINGGIVGDVYASEHIELAAKAVVNGNVHYKVIEMVKGAEVNGNLMHLTDAGQTDTESSLTKDESAAVSTKTAKPKTAEINSKQVALEAQG